MIITDLSRHDMKTIENYIKNIDKLRFRMQVRRLELLDNPIVDNPGGGKSNLPGDPVNREVTICLTDDYYNHLDKIVKGVEKVYNDADEEVQKIFRLKYWEPILGVETWDDIADVLNYSKTSVLRVRAKYLKDIANEIEFINSDFSLV